MKKCSPHRILVADDDPGCRQVYATLIRECFPTAMVDFAPNGEVALDIVIAQHPTGVVMDVHMPVQNGAISARHILEHCAKNDWELPLIVLLAFHVPTDWTEGLMKPDTSLRILPKPVRSDDLINSLRQRLTNK